MADEAYQEGVVPAGALDFAAHRLAVRMGAQNVEGESSQGGEVLRRVVFPRPVLVLIHDDVEHPVQLVFDAPVRAHRRQQPLGRDIFGEQEVAHRRRVGGLATVAAARGDAAQRLDPGKVCFVRKAGRSQYGGASRLAPVMAARLDPFGDAALAAAGEAVRSRGEQLAPVGLQRHHVIAAALSHHSGKAAMAMQRIGGHDAALEIQRGECFHGTRALIAAGSLALRQTHPCLHRPDVDHVQRRALPAALERPAQPLAVDRYHARGLQLVGLGKAHNEPPEHCLEGLGLQHAEHPAEGVVAGDTVLKPQQQPQTASAMNRTSHRSCRALSARGSGNRRKTLLKAFIRHLPMVRRGLQNPIRQAAQYPAQIHMRFPCPQGGGIRIHHSLTVVSGLHVNSRSSIMVRSHSAISATTAITIIAANTPLESNEPWAVAISSPMPSRAPKNSPTMAPTSAKPKLTCRLARIHDSAEGITTARVICQSLAPRMRAFAIRFLSASRTPWNALANTTKNTITTASAIFDAAPKPNATMKIEPSTTRGIEFATLM